jgi:hypothetical protein
MSISKTLSCGIAALLLTAGGLAAQETEDTTEVISAEGAEALEVNIDFTAGTLDISPLDSDDAARLDVYYTPRYVRYSVDYTKRGTTGRLLLESERRGRRHHDEDVKNEWNLGLSTKYPMELDLDVGACEAYIDLGGLRLTDLSMDIGAASGTIDFSKPNPERLREMTLDIGASSVEIYNLGGANADRISCDVGAGSVELDFRDGVKGECELNLDVGVGSADIVVPKDMAIRLEGDNGWFSDIDFHGIKLREVDDGVWETPDFDEATDRLIIEASVAMGSIDVKGRR